MHSHPSGEQSGGLPGFLRTDSIEYLCGTGEGALAKKRHITRLTERQGILSGHVESIRNHLATTQGKPRP